MAFSNNSNTLPTPFFVQNQTLRADDLNAMVEYFEDQSRLTRIFTIGIGILKGLKIELDFGNGNVLNSIAITPGIGISSDGILFEIDSKCIFHFFKPSSISKKAFHCDVDGKRGKCSDDEERVDGVYELFVNNEEDLDRIAIEEITSFDIENHCLVLVHCKDTVERKSCFNDCEQKGADILSQTRVLLVPHEILNVADEDTPDDVNTVSIALPPTIERFGYTNDELNLFEIKNWSDLYIDYKERCENAVNDIVHSYDSTFLGFIELITPNGQNPFIELTDLLTELKDKYSTNPVPNVSDIQYCYAYFRDLTLAYEEFFKLACGLSIGINISTSDDGFDVRCSFPGYVALGNIRKALDIADIEDLAPANCRTGFFPAAASEGVNERQSRAEMLYQRLIDLTKPIAGADIPDVSLQYHNLRHQTIKITGSCTQKSGLSHQAIPFYLKLNKLRNNWNVDNPNCAQMSELVTHYDLSNMDNNILLKRFDVFDFYRVEGHLGYELDKAVGEIEKNRKDLNLPFDIRTLRIGPESKLEDIFTENNELYFGEMQEVFLNTKADLLCKIEEEGIIDTDGNVNHDLEDDFKTLLGNIFTLKDLTKVDITQMQTLAVNTSISASVGMATTIFDNLCEKYIKIIEDINRSMSFPLFAEDHPGMEHLGGAPRGGTLILVYAYRFNSSLEKREIGGLFGINVDNKSDEQVLYEVFDILEYEEYLTILKNAVRKIVVADFCLPYLCCSNSPVIRNEFRQADLQIFSDDKICWEILLDADENGIPIILEYSVSPEGGTIQYFVDGVQIGDDINNASTDNQVDILSLITEADFTEGEASFNIRYILGSLVEEKTIKVYKKPDTAFECVKKDKIINADCKWVGYQYEFTHQLVAGEVDTAQWNIGGEVIDVDVETNTFTYDIKTDNANFNLPIQVSLFAENNGCENSSDKEITDFCPNEINLDLLGGCEAVEDGLQQDVYYISCKNFIPQGEPFTQEDGIGFIEISPDFSGGEMTITSTDVANTDNFLIKQCNSQEGVHRPRYFFIYDLSSVSNEAKEALGVPAGVDQVLIPEDGAKFDIRYTLPPCNIEQEITITVMPNAGNPEPKPADEGNGDDDGGDFIIEAKIGVDPDNKPKPQSAKQPKAATLSKTAIQLLQTRSASQKEVLVNLEQNKKLANLKGFKLARTFIVLPPNSELKNINAVFNGVMNSLSRVKSASKADLTSIVTSILHSYLDKQVVLSPNVLEQSSKELLQKHIKKLKAMKISLAPISKSWEGAKLKKAFNAKVVDEILKNLK